MLGVRPGNVVDELWGAQVEEVDTEVAAFKAGRVGDVRDRHCG